MKLKAILFDLDGTLLPMPKQDAFIRYYFSELAKYLVPYGYDPKALIGAVWKGVERIMHNDGANTNEVAFWNGFASVFGEKAREDEAHFAAFYEENFDRARVMCGYNDKAAETVRAIRAMGLRTALATNPVFPEIATRKRMGWAGLTKDDFEFYTTYENSSFCKPSLSYYREVLDRMGVRPEEALMVGNDVDDDMVATNLGMKVFLLTDCLINTKNADISVFPHGGFDDLLSFIRKETEADRDGE